MYQDAAATLELPSHLYSLGYRNLTIRHWRTNAMFTVDTWDAGVFVRDVDGNEVGDPGMPFLNDRLIETVPDVAQFAAGVPAEVSSGIRRIHTCQTYLLHLVRHYAAMYDLFMQNPVLAAMLAIALFDGGGTLSGTHLRLMKRKQREIAGHLGFPPTNRTVNLLGKIQIDDPLVRRHAPALREILANDWIAKRLTHFTALPLDLLYYMLKSDIVRHTRLLVGLLREAEARGQEQAGEYSASCQEFYEDARDFGLLTVGLRTADEMLGKCESLAELRSLHDRWYRLHEKQRLGAILALEFPEPPYPGTVGIHPLDSPEKLVQEGDEMQHCCSTYAEGIVRSNGDSYFFKLDAPGRERVTFLVRGIRRVPWIAEAKLAHNDNPKPATMQYLRQWLDASHRRKLGEGRAA